MTATSERGHFFFFRQDGVSLHEGFLTSYPSFALRSTFQSGRWKMSVSVHEAHHKMFIVLITEGCAYDFVVDSCRTSIISPTRGLRA